jgi:hypothetical protein
MDPITTPALPANPIPADVVINGGKEILVYSRDGKSSETVKVRLVPLSQASKYLDLVTDIAQFVEFIVGKPKGWADCISDDSLFELDALAKELNDPRIDRVLARQKSTVERLAPKARELSALTS